MQKKHTSTQQCSKALSKRGFAEEYALQRALIDPEQRQIETKEVPNENYSFDHRMPRAQVTSGSLLSERIRSFKHNESCCSPLEAQHGHVDRRLASFKRKPFRMQSIFRRRRNQPPCRMEWAPRKERLAYFCGSKHQISSPSALEKNLKNTILSWQNSNDR